MKKERRSARMQCCGAKQANMDANCREHRTVALKCLRRGAIYDNSQCDAAALESDTAAPMQEPAENQIF